MRKRFKRFARPLQGAKGKVHECVQFYIRRRVPPSTIDLYMSKGMGIPPYRKLGEARNAKVIWNIVDISEYLTQTIKTV